MRTILVIVMGLALAQTARAQIVNTQPLLEKGGDEGLGGELRGAFEWRSGNVDLVRLLASALFTFRAADHTIISSSSVELGSSGGERHLFRTFSHLRHQLRVSSLVTWETFAQVAHDEFRRITLRALAGTGPRWTLFADEGARLDLGTAYMLEHEVYADDPTLGDGDAERTRHRASIYIRGRYSLDERLGLVGTFYYQPALTDLDDWLMLAEAQLAVELVRSLSLTVALTIAYDATPPQAIEPLDTSLLVGVGWTF